MMSTVGVDIVDKDLQVIPVTSGPPLLNVIPFLLIGSCLYQPTSDGLGDTQRVENVSFLLSPLLPT